jgi:uncharacterized protein involved in exopolysaccharide biosynthesis
MSEGKDAGRSEVLAGPPSGYFLVVPATADQQLFDVHRVARVLRGAWILLLTLSALGAAAAALISFQVRNTFRAEAIVVPVTEGFGQVSGAVRNQLSGLAAVAGIDVGSLGEHRAQSLATLTSHSFAREFIRAENLTPVLFFDRWDAKGNHWRAGAKQPTTEEAVRKFTESVRFVKESRTNGLITVSVEWYSPELASQWANKTIEMVNERLRTEAIQNADRSIQYLNEELVKTNVIELRQAIYRLIEDQVKSAMLANVQREYAFRVIDPAVPPDRKFKPKRSIMVLIGTATGLLLGVLAAFLWSGYFTARK